MAKETPKELYFKLGDGARSFYDPYSKLKLAGKGVQKIATEKAQASAMLANALKKGHIAYATEEEFTAGQAISIETEEETTTTGNEGGNDGSGGNDDDDDDDDDDSDDDDDDDDDDKEEEKTTPNTASNSRGRGRR